MNFTYAQRQIPAQKKDAPSASSVFDASSQSESLQRKAEMANAAAQRANAPRPNNTGMPDNLKAGIESLSGFSMDDVRVHYNSSKPATVQALAYTQGTDIHVAPGQEKCLPHEAWHVAQQMAGRVSPTTNINGMPVNDNAALEHEADVMGEKAMQRKKMTYTQFRNPLNHLNIMQCLTVKRNKTDEGQEVYNVKDLVATINRLKKCYFADEMIFVPVFLRDLNKKIRLNRNISESVLSLIDLSSANSSQAVYDAVESYIPSEKIQHFFVNPQYNQTKYERLLDLLSASVPRDQILAIEGPQMTFGGFVDYVNTLKRAEGRDEGLIDGLVIKEYYCMKNVFSAIEWIAAQKPEIVRFEGTKDMHKDTMDMIDNQTIDFLVEKSGVLLNYEGACEECYRNIFERKSLAEGGGTKFKYDGNRVFHYSHGNKEKRGEGYSCHVLIVQDGTNKTIIGVGYHTGPTSYHLNWKADDIDEKYVNYDLDKMKVDTEMKKSEKKTEKKK